MRGHALQKGRRKLLSSGQRPAIAADAVYSRFVDGIWKQISIAAPGSGQNLPSSADMLQLLQAGSMQPDGGSPARHRAAYYHP